MIEPSDQAEPSGARRSADSEEGPAALLRDLRAHWSAFGITRLADQTGLDRLGIPCFAAIRPNSATVATHQGKGVDARSAQISAVMEAVEYRFAEAPDVPVLEMSSEAARAAGYGIFDVGSLLPRGMVVAPEQPLRWLVAEELDAAQPLLVPADAVILGTPPRDLIAISQSTNGLAAGRDRDGALLHGLLEMVERDAMCLWGFRSDKTASATVLDAAALGDAEVDALVARIAAVGFVLRLFDMTTDIGVPTIYAVLAPGDRPDRHLDAATGAGCHPVPAIAARRAIVEAAQTRISIIAGARDDIDDADYGSAVGRDLAVLLAMQLVERAAPKGMSRQSTLAEQIAFVRDGLRKAKCPRVVVLALGGARYGVEVLRVFIPGLEDRLTNKNWRPGPRAARAMLGLI